MTTADLIAPPAVAVRSAGPSLPRLTALELRKSLSTRSGHVVTMIAYMMAPHMVPVLLANGTPLGDASAMLAELGKWTGLVLLAIGVLSTAGEWTHRTYQGTFLAVPRRERVLAAKALAMALLGAACTAFGMVSAVAILAVWGPPMTWAPVLTTIAVTSLGGAVFTVVGAGVGAAAGNAAAALTGAYLTLFIVPPVLSRFSPRLGDLTDLGGAVTQLATGASSAVHVITIALWLTTTAVAGLLVTRRRAVA